MGVQNWFSLTQSWHPAHFFQPANVASLRIIGRIGPWGCSDGFLGEELGPCKWWFFFIFTWSSYTQTVYTPFISGHLWKLVGYPQCISSGLSSYAEKDRKGVFCEDLWQWKCCHHHWVIWMPLFCNRLDLGTFHIFSPGAQVHHVLTAMLVDIATSLIPSVAPPWIRGLTWKTDVASHHNGPGVDN